MSSDITILQEREIGCMHQPHEGTTHKYDSTEYQKNASGQNKPREETRELHGVSRGALGQENERPRLLHHALPYSLISRQSTRRLSHSPT